MARLPGRPPERSRRPERAAGTGCGSRRSAPIRRTGTATRRRPGARRRDRRANRVRRRRRPGRPQETAWLPPARLRPGRGRRRRAADTRSSFAPASGTLQAGDWTSDSLHETGTYDWLETNFGKEIAETIRLQPFAKRFLATVIPKYFSCLTTSAQCRVVSDGGFMTASERMTFGNNRCHHHAMKIASWIDRGVERHVQVPEMDFFRPFIEHAIGSFGTPK